MNASNTDNNRAKITGSRKLRQSDQESTNPCWKEHILSFKCLDRNFYDYDKCQLQFENYKVCKSFWGHVIAERRRHNIKPYVPLPEERDKIKAKYLSTGRI